MARMHSRKKGKHTSRRPVLPQKPSWQRYSAKEIEMVVAKLSKEDKNTSQIGIILRDSYGIPDAQVLLGKRLQAVLKEKKLLPALPDELSALLKKAAIIQKHMQNNKQDETARRGLLLTQSKIQRLAKYFKRTGRLPENWKYSKAQTQLLA